jgi:hypothetical protein
MVTAQNIFAEDRPVQQSKAVPVTGRGGKYVEAPTFSA